MTVTSQRFDGNRRSRRRCLLALLVLMSALAAGCWDRVEINRRAMVAAIGIDLPQEQTGSTEGGEKPHELPARFMMSLEIPLLRVMQDSPSASITPEIQKPGYVLVSEGRTLYSIERNLASRLSRQLFWGHTKLVVIGEALAREVGLYPIMDFLTRDLEYDRRLRIVVAEGDALPIIEAAVVSENLIGPYVAQILETGPASSGAPRVTIHHLDAQMYEGGNILLPRVALSSTDIDLSGSAVIKSGRMLGWLGNVQTQWALFARDEVRGGWIAIQDPQHADSEVLYDIRSSKTSLSMQIQEGKPTFHIRVITEGDILERVAFPSDLSQGVIREIEDALASEIESGIKETILALQETFNTDVLGFGDHIRKRHPKVWEQLKNDWDDVGFREAQFTVRSQVNVRRHGGLQ